MKLLTWLMVLGLLLAAVACGGGSPTGGVWFGGNTLVINLVELRKVPEVRYQDVDFKHYVVRPAEGNELVVVHLDVRNSIATKVFLNVDEEALRLRDSSYKDYNPINPFKQRVEVEGPHPDEDRYAPFIWGSMELPKEWGVEGWVVFEVPRGLKFVQLVWEAGDTVYMEF